MSQNNGNKGGAIIGFIIVIVFIIIAFASCSGGCSSSSSSSSKSRSSSSSKSYSSASDYIKSADPDLWNTMNKRWNDLATKGYTTYN